MTPRYMTGGTFNFPLGDRKEFWQEKGVARKCINEKKYTLLTSREWLDEKRNTDGAEGLWRIHDGLYDLSAWMENHPGGKHWLEVSQGTDVTEAFECHHITKKAEKVLGKFYVRPAKSKRNSLITFEENGFYRSLKRKIVERKLVEVGRTGPQWKSKLFADVLAAGVFATAILASSWTPWFLLVSGVLLGMLTVCAHNFFHMRNNWRMYYFQLSLMSLRDWRVSHVLSHHLYPNTSWDLEVTMFLPLINFLPRIEKFWCLSWVLSPFIMVSLAHVQFLRRIKSLHKDVKAEGFGFSLLVFLLLFGDQGPWWALLFWTAIVAAGSFTFAFLGLTAAHHHPQIYHEGDFFGPDRDFGIVQLAAVRNREEVDGSVFLSLVSFGNHALHHLFPTVDHSRLPLIESVFEETCNEFKIDFKPFKTKNLISGMWRQLARRHTNPILHILPHKYPTQLHFSGLCTNNSPQRFKQ